MSSRKTPKSHTSLPHSVEKDPYLRKPRSAYMQLFFRRLTSYTSTLLSSICRPFLRFELFSTIFHNRAIPSEVPKKIIKHSKWEALSLCYIHLIPVLISTILLVLNFANVFYQPVGASNQNLSFDALQFAAKVHEILIAASLSAIVLHYIQYELLHGRGIPLGSLLAGFQVADVGSLWSPGLWATCFATRDGKKARCIMLVILVFLTVVLGAVVGPSSAILMIPSVSWWHYQLANIYGELYGFQDNTNPRFLIFANESTLWPNHIGGKDVFPSVCDSIDDQAPPYCPLGGLSALLGQASGIWRVQNDENLTTQETPGNGAAYSRYIEWWYDSAAFWAQTTQLSTNNLLASLQDFQYQKLPFNEVQNDFQELGDIRWSLDTLKSEQLLAPSTYVECHSNFYAGNISSGPYSVAEDIGNYTADPEYNYQSYSYTQGGLVELIFPLPYNLTWSSAASPLLAVWNSTTKMAALWVEPVDLGETAPSIGLVSAVFANGTLPVDIENSTLFNYSATISTCSIYAYWSPVEIYLDPFIDSYIHATYINQAQSDMQPIKIDIDWANHALPPNATVGRLAMALADEPFTTNIEEETWPIPLGIASSLFITDVISRIGMEKDSVIAPRGVQLNQSQFVYRMPNNSAENLGFNAKNDNLTEFSFTLVRYGFSYSTDGITRRLAIGILFLHILIAMIYTVVTVRLGWSYYGLKSLCEIVVLAINSVPSRTLDNTSAGIERFDTYKHVVKVREVSGERLAIVVDDDKRSFVTPVDGKKYR